MRILIGNVHFWPDSFGGATVVAEQTAAGLRNRGHDVVVFTSTADADLPDYRLFRYSADGMPVLAVKIPRARPPEHSYDNDGVAQRFAEVLDALQPDVVHLHAVQELGVGVAEAAQARGIPTVVTLHDAWWLCERQFMVRQTGQYCGQSGIDAKVCATCVADPAGHAQRQRRSLEILNRCAAVLSPSRFWRDLMVASGVDGRIAHVNANGVSRPAPGWRREPTPGVARIGYVGGTSPVKGYPQLVEALRSIRRSDYELVVVDSFANLGLVTMTHTDWPVPGLVRLVPGYTAEGVDEFFAGLDALVFPSQWKESYGLTVREAALRGVWPILPTGGGTAEHFTDGRNATVYPRQGGVAALAAALDDYLDHFADRTPDASLIATIPTYAQQTVSLEEQLTRAVRSAAQPGAQAAQPGTR